MLKLISIIKKSLIHPSVIILLLVNIIPMAGVIYFSWDVFAIMILYWLESVIVGFLNVVRMIKINNNSLNSKFIPFFIVSTRNLVVSKKQCFNTTLSNRLFSADKFKYLQQNPSSWIRISINWILIKKVKIINLYNQL